jgi:hypothetical protein
VTLETKLGGGRLSFHDDEWEANSWCSGSCRRSQGEDQWHRNKRSRTVGAVLWTASPLPQQYKNRKESHETMFGGKDSRNFFGCVRREPVAHEGGACPRFLRGLRLARGNALQSAIPLGYLVVGTGGQIRNRACPRFPSARWARIAAGCGLWARPRCRVGILVAAGAAGATWPNVARRVGVRFGRPGQRNTAYDPTSPLWPPLPGSEFAQENARNLFTAPS